MPDTRWLARAAPLPSVPEGLGSRGLGLSLGNGGRGVGCKVQGPGCRVLGVGRRVYSVRCEATGSGFAPLPSAPDSGVRVTGVTSLTRKPPPLGPYRRPMPRVLVWS